MSETDRLKYELNAIASVIRAQRQGEAAALPDNSDKLKFPDWTARRFMDTGEALPASEVRKLLAEISRLQAALTAATEVEKPMTELGAELLQRAMTEPTYSVTVTTLRREIVALRKQNAELRAGLEAVCKLAADKNAGFADILQQARKALAP